MAAFTAGELKTLNYIPEVTYGVTPVTALTWGGDIEEFTPTDDMKVRINRISGTRSTFDATRDAAEMGFKLKCRARAAAGGTDWRALWAAYAFGSTTALTDHLGSFSAQVLKTVGASNYYTQYSGCKLDKLGISAASPGEPWMFEADVMARWKQNATAKAIVGLQSLTVGANATDTTTSPLTWNGASQYNIGGGLVTWYPKSIKFGVDNAMQRQMGNVVGADAVKYSVPIGISEGARDITLEANLWYADETFVNARLNNTAVTAVTIPIDTFTVTLSNGVFMANDFPALKHDLMEETVKINFKSLTIA
jgi:hypothetical protein